MSDLDNLMSGTTGAVATPQKQEPSDLEKLMHGVDVGVSAIDQGAINTPAYLGDVLTGAVQDVVKNVGRSIQHPFNPNPDFSHLAQAIKGEGPITKGFNQNVTEPLVHPTEPTNTTERYVAAGGQGIGGMLTGGAEVKGASDLAKLLGVGAGAGVAAQGVQDEFPNSGIAPALAGFATGAILHHAVRGSGDLVAKGQAYPEYQALADHVIPSNEGGGTFEEPKVNAKSGATGPMQVTMATAKDPGYGIKPWDGKSQEDLARVGREKLAALMGKYDGDPMKAMAAYDWGEGNVDKAVNKFGDNWLHHAPEETVAYVSKGMIKLRGESGQQTLGSVPPMKPEDIAKALNDPEAAGILNEIGKDDVSPEQMAAGLDAEDAADRQDSNIIDLGTQRAWNNMKAQQTVKGQLDGHMDEAERVMDAMRTGEPLDISSTELKNFQEDAQNIRDNLAKDSPLRPIADNVVKTWDQISGAIDSNGAVSVKPEIDPLAVQGADKFLGQEPYGDEPANDMSEQDAEDRMGVYGFGDKGTGPQSEQSENAGGTGGKPPKEPPSPGAGSFGGGGEPPEGEGSSGDKYAASINLDRMAISNKAKDLIRNAVPPQGNPIETFQEAKQAALDYIDKHGVEGVLNRESMPRNEVNAHDQAVRAINAAAAEHFRKINDEYTQMRKEGGWDPDIQNRYENAAELFAKSTKQNNENGLYAGRGLGARRIFVGGRNGDLGERINELMDNKASMDKINDMVNQNPEQAGDILNDAAKPGWAEYFKSLYYGPVLLSRLTTSLGIFASVSLSHVVEAAANAATMLAGVHPTVATAFTRGEFEGLKHVGPNVAQAWREGVPTDKANLIQSRVNLKGPLGYPGRLIAATDEFFGTLGRYASAYSKAAQTAYAAGLRGSDLKAYMTEHATKFLKDSDVVEAGKALRLQDSPTPLGKLFKQGLNSPHPYISIPATLITPFVNIADRLMMMSIRMTPGLSFTDRITRNNWNTSNYGKLLASNRQMMGLGIGAYTVAQVLQGNVTGQGPSDPNKHNLWLASHQPDSIKIDGKWVSYERLPFSSLVSAAATATERFQETGNQKGYMNEIEGIFLGAGSGLLHSHYLEGLANLADTFSSGSNDKVADFFGRELKSFIPGLAQQANEAFVDNKVRDTRGNPLIDNFKAGLFGASKTLPARHDVYGNVETYEGGASRMVNPFPYRSAPQDQLHQAMDALNTQASGVVLSTPSKHITINGEKHTLSEQGYQKYIARSGQIFQENMRQNLGSLQGLSTKDKVALVRQTMKDAHSQARSELWGAD